jgi:hypothetical protein
MIIASNAFLEPQHSFSTSPGMATGALTLARNRSPKLYLLAIIIHVMVDYHLIHDV